jgi:hypothetical protein
VGDEDLFEECVAILMRACVMSVVRMLWISKSIEKVVYLMKKEEKGRELGLYFGLKARWLGVRRWKMKKVNGGAGKCRIYIVENQILSMMWQGRSGAAYSSGDCAGADRSPPPPPDVSC